MKKNIRLLIAFNIWNVLWKVLFYNESDEVEVLAWIR